MMSPRAKKRFRRVLVVLLALWVLLLLAAHPFFAVTSPSGGQVLVIEGWMHREGLKEASALYRTGTYEQICITGTERPFAYYLGAGDTLDMHLATGTSGEMVLSTAGLPDAQWSLTIDGTQSAAGPGTDDLSNARVPLENAGAVRITARSNATSATSKPVIFIGGLWVNGENAHRIDARVQVVRSTGVVEEAQATFAHQAYYLLRELGVPEDRMTVVPTMTVTESRTLSTARDFAIHARATGIRSFDVATLGVHARRTRTMYRKAFGTNEGIGIIALPDRWCPRWKWWTSQYGWYQVMKELVAWPAPWLMENDAPTDP